MKQIELPRDVDAAPDRTTCALPPSRYRRLSLLLVPALASAAILVATWVAPSIPALRDLLPTSDVGAALWLLGKLLAAAALAMFSWRIVLASRYRPAPGLADEHLPAITVVVPAYNEGAQVFHTLRSILASDYPAHKLNVVAVDDGSRDDTWAWIRAASAAAHGRIATIHYPRNRGKRYALDCGFEASTGDVVVTIDSDSEVAIDTLRNLVSPFADRRVGAVAGNVRVLARVGGAIARMLDCAFTYSFDFIRAAQSELDTVMCTPGALSAYRRDLVMAVRERWLGQTFLGVPANIGEDRAMTNLILREGYFVKYQSNARVFTDVPTTLPKLARMLLRWARSNVRESWVMATFIWRRFRPSSALGARLQFAFHGFTLLWASVAWIPLVAALVAAPALGAAALAAGFALGGLAPALVYVLIRNDRRRALWAFVYAPYSVFALGWIKPYALATARRNGWLTRGAATAPRATVASNAREMGALRAS